MARHEMAINIRAMSWHKSQVHMSPLLSITGIAGGRTELLKMPSRILMFPMRQDALGKRLNVTAIEARTDEQCAAPNRASEKRVWHGIQHFSSTE